MAARGLPPHPPCLNLNIYEKGVKTMKQFTYTIKDPLGNDNLEQNDGYAK